MFQTSAFVMFGSPLFTLVIITYSTQTVFGYPRPEKIDDNLSPVSTASPPLPERTTEKEDVIKLISTVDGEVPETLSCPSYKDTHRGTTVFLHDFQNATGHRVRKQIVVDSMYDAIEVVRICLMSLIRQGKSYFHHLFADDRYQGIDVTDFFLPFQAMKVNVQPQPQDFSTDENGNPLQAYDTETSTATSPTVLESNGKPKEDSSDKQVNYVEKDMKNQTSPKEES